MTDAQNTLEYYKMEARAEAKRLFEENSKLRRENETLRAENKDLTFDYSQVMGRLRSINGLIELTEKHYDFFGDPKGVLDKDNGLLGRIKESCEVKKFDEF